MIGLDQETDNKINYSDRIIIIPENINSTSEKGNALGRQIQKKEVKYEQGQRSKEKNVGGKGKLTSQIINVK